VLLLSPAFWSWALIGMLPARSSNEVRAATPEAMRVRGKLRIDIVNSRCEHAALKPDRKQMSLYYATLHMSLPFRHIRGMIVQEGHSNLLF
jgi:hypothetical protein